MKTKRLKLKKWASTIIYVSIVMIVFISMVFVNNLLDGEFENNTNLSYILKTFIDEEQAVINYDEEKIIKPFSSETVTIDIDFYDKDSEEDRQQKSIILYENTYMPNTGILYTNEEKFDVYATLEGTVSKVSQDELLGNIVEITHSTSLVTTYYSIDNINVKEGQILKQGDIIGTSGKNNISTTSDNMLLFEVSMNGINIDPEVYYETNINDLN